MLYEIRFITIQQFIISLTNCVQESVSFDCEYRVVKEIMNSWFNIQTTRAKGIYRILETVFEFVFSYSKWLKPRLVTNFSPFELLQLKTLFAFGLMKLKIFFLKSVKLLTFRSLESSSFHSITADGKTEFLKNYLWF